MRVASIVQSDMAGLIEESVSIVDSGSAPVAGAKVTGAWSGQIAPGHSADQAVRTQQCITNTSGSCLLTLSPDMLPVTPPINFVITNVEQPQYVYEPQTDNVPPTAQ